MGGKRTRFDAASKAAAPAKSATTGDTLSRAAVHLERVLSLVEAAIDKGDANPAVIRESAGVARAIATLSAEQRARERQADEAGRRAARALTVPTVIAFLRQLDADGRRTVQRELQRLEQATRPGSVLG